MVLILGVSLVTACGGSSGGVRVIGEQVEEPCSPAAVGRAVTDTVTVTGGSYPYTVQWVVDGKVVAPSELDVQMAPDTESMGKGALLTFTVVPMSANEEIVLDVDGGHSSYGGKAFFSGTSRVVMGNGGLCPIGQPVGVNPGPAAKSLRCAKAAVVGRPVTETVTETGGTRPYTFEWVLDGRVVSAAALSVRTASYRDIGGKGLELTFTVVPASTNDILVLDANGADAAIGGWSYLVLGKGGGCLITAVSS